MSRSKILNSALGAAFVAAMAAATPAQALEPKQCLPMAEMNAALKAEGQRTMIIGDRLDIQNPTGLVKDASVLRYVNTVTSNADGSLGYQLEGDLPRAKPSTKVCVAAKLTNIRFFDARKPGLNTQAMLGGAFDDILRENEAIGTRPMAQADTVYRNPDGTHRRGLPLTVFGNLPERAGGIYARDTDGKALRLAVMGDTEYTQAGLQMVGGVTQVAMRGPN
jgi:hypothetical protein